MASVVSDPSALPPIPPEIAEVAERFLAAGFELFLVGGAVRDQALGLEADGPDGPGDLDLTTNARPDRILDLLTPMATSIWRQGERFGTIGATIAGRALEITTYRQESYNPSSRKPEVSFGDDLETDLSRRDFTINAMARDAQAGTLVDPFDGWADLVAGRLRTPLAPAVSFSDDPLRMLRAARFGARFGMAFDGDLLAAASDLADRMAIVSGERIAAEMERLLTLPHPEPGIRFIWEAGVLATSLGADELPSFDVAQTAVARMSQTGLADGEVQPGGEIDTGIRWAALLSLAGLSPTALARRLRMSSARQSDLESLSRPWTPTSEVAALRRMLLDLGEQVPLRRAVVKWIVDGPSPQLDSFISAFTALKTLTTPQQLKSPLSGDEIIAHLGIEPGRAVGDAISAIEAESVRCGPLNADQARAFLDAKQ